MIENDTHYWKRNCDTLSKELLFDCARLDERYFMNDYLDRFSFDLCIVPPIPRFYVESNRVSTGNC